MLQKFFVTSLCLAMAVPACLQVSHCQADEMLADQIKSDPARALMIDKIERHTHDFSKNASSRSGQKVKIPEVVHIV